MLKRVISGVIGVPILIGVVYQGGIILYLSLMAICLIGLREFYQAVKAGGIDTIDLVGYASTIFLLSSFYFSYSANSLLLTMVGTMIALSMIILINNNRYTVLDGAITFIGVIYVSLFLGHILLISRSLNSIAIWLVFITAFGTDTFAYFTGYFFGSKKLCPSISPKKTVEGAIGGIVGTVSLCGIFGFIYLREYMAVVLVTGLAGSILSQAGDLTASSIKRRVGLKDFGNIIPGHGGILDRFDSIIFTAPVVFYFVEYMINKV